MLFIYDRHRVSEYISDSDIVNTLSSGNVSFLVFEGQYRPDLDDADISDLAGSMVEKMLSDDVFMLGVDHSRPLLPLYSGQGLDHEILYVKNYISYPLSPNKFSPKKSASDEIKSGLLTLASYIFWKNQFKSIKMPFEDRILSVESDLIIKSSPKTE